MSDQPIALDFASLREQAISQLERMSGAAWTDFNLHDPGITIMEVFCYALTDLAYRTSYSIPDLLADGGGDEYESLHKAPDILPCCPVTVTDLRRLVLDVEGVKNAWIEEVRMPAPDLPSTEPVTMKGLYRVLIETADIAGIDGTEVRRMVALRLHKNRGLCEDFVDVQVLNPQKIQVHTALEIGPVEDTAGLLVRVMLAIESRFSPTIPAVELGSLLDAGKAVEDIFEGPMLERGFIPPETLAAGDRRKTINISEIIHAVMDVPDIRAVRSMTLSTGEKTEAWSLPVDSQMVPHLEIGGSTFRLMRDGIPVLDFSRAAADYDQVFHQYILRRVENAATTASALAEDPLALPAGRDRSAGNYYSLQHHLPAA